MKPNRLPFLLLLHLSALLQPGPAGAAVTFWEELRYFSAADSPFYDGIQAAVGGIAQGQKAAAMRGRRWTGHLRRRD